jgi:hypothetical protein
LKKDERKKEKLENVKEREKMPKGIKEKGVYMINK